MRLIDADAIKNDWFEFHQPTEEEAAEGCMATFRVLIDRKRIDDAPTIDAVPVVRCKDCKHCEYVSNRVPTERAWVCYKCLCDVEQDWFCADGERKDDGNK